MHKGVTPSDNQISCPSTLLHNFKPQQDMQADPGILSDPIDAIIFAKLGSSLDHAWGMQVCVLVPSGAVPRTITLQNALHQPHRMQGFTQAVSKSVLKGPDSSARLPCGKTLPRRRRDVVQI